MFATTCAIVSVDKQLFSTHENVAKTNEMLARSPRKFIRRAAQEIVIKRESLRKINRQRLETIFLQIEN